MRMHYDDAALDFENAVGDACFFDKCARAFARAGHGLKAAGEAASAAQQLRRARVYRGKAHKRLNAARQHLPYH